MCHEVTESVTISQVSEGVQDQRAVLSYLYESFLIG